MDQYGANAVVWRYGKTLAVLRLCHKGKSEEVDYEQSEDSAGNGVIRHGYPRIRVRGWHGG
jgi:hypothetical protein